MCKKFCCYKLTSIGKRLAKSILLTKSGSLTKPLGLFELAGKIACECEFIQRFNGANFSIEYFLNFFREKSFFTIVLKMPPLNC